MAAINELRKLRQIGNLTAEDTVDILRKKFPKIDKTCISKAESEKYGIGLSREAMRYLRREILGTPNAKEKRIKSHCISVRLTDGQYGLLQQHLERSGQSAQEFFAAKVNFGQWDYMPERQRYGVFCSACGSYSDNKSIYCPWCGTKMNNMGAADEDCHCE